MSYGVGIDLGGTNIKTALVSKTGAIAASYQTPTPLAKQAQTVLAEMAQAVQTMVAKSGVPWREIDQVGVGTPGSVDQKEGMVIYANNLPFDHTPLGPYLQKALGVPVYVCNDADAAAWGELCAGAGQGLENMVAITLGTGIGAGQIVRGKLYVGSHGAGGEWGHTVLEATGPQCNCGRKGCWEVFCAVPTLVRQTKRAMKKNPSSKLWQVAGSLAEVEGKTVFDAIRLGDETAAGVLDRYLDWLAVGIGNVINAMDPEMVCIGGGLSGAGPLLLEPLRKKIVLYKRKGETIIALAALGNAAGLVGASMLSQSNG